MPYDIFTTVYTFGRVAKQKMHFMKSGKVTIIIIIITITIAIMFGIKGKKLKFLSVNYLHFLNDFPVSLILVCKNQ